MDVPIPPQSMRAKQPGPPMIAGFHRPVARYGGPDQPVDLLNRLDPGLDNTHPVHINSDPICIRIGVMFIT